VQASVTICTILDLHDLVHIKLGRQRGAGAVQDVELAGLGADRPLRRVLLGDVVALDEDAGRAAVLRHDRLIDEIEIALIKSAVRTLLQIHGRAAAYIGLAGSIDLIEQAHEALLDYFRKRLGHGPTHDIATVDERAIGLVDHGEPMLWPAEHRDEAGGLRKHALKAFALGLERALDPHLVRDLDNNSDDAGRSAVLARDGGIVEVEPDLLRLAAVPVKRERKIPIGQRLAGEPHLHDVIVEVGDLGPTLPDLGAEQLRMAAPGEPGIAVVVDHDSVLAPQSDDWDRRTQDEGDRALKARRPALDRTQRRRSPVETRDDLGGFPSSRQKRKASGDGHVQTGLRPLAVGPDTLAT
jgi:hypothetical protein